MPQLIDGKYIESIAKQMGVEFRRATTVAQYRAHIQKYKGSVFPDLIFLLDIGVPIHRGPKLVGESPETYDAVLRYKSTELPLNWGAVSKASIRKFLKRGSESEEHECIVCYQEYPLSYQVCYTCGSNVCTFCEVKMCLTPQSINFLMSGLEAPEVPVKCVQCRVEVMIDLRTLTHEVFDRLRDFDEDQQKALLFLKDSDPNFEIKLKNWKNRILSYKKWTTKRFKKGCRVRTQGLKSARQWNGRIGKIIGERVIKNDVIRWPVQLTGKSAKSQAKLLLKGVNMQKI